VYCRVARGEVVFDDEYEVVEFVETLRDARGLDGRIELITLALSRCGLRARDFASLLDKHGATFTRWLKKAFGGSETTPR